MAPLKIVPIPYFLIFPWDPGQVVKEAWNVKLSLRGKMELTVIVKIMPPCTVYIHTYTEDINITLKRAKHFLAPHIIFLSTLYSEFLLLLSILFHLYFYVQF